MKANEPDGDTHYHMHDPKGRCYGDFIHREDAVNSLILDRFVVEMTLCIYNPRCRPEYFLHDVVEAPS